MAQDFVQRGYRVVPFGELADVTVINTCTVTDGADSRCRNTIRRAHRASPEGVLVVTGCYAQMSPQRLAKMAGVDLVLGTSQRHKIFDYLEVERERKVFIDKTNEFWGGAQARESGRTRAFLKIQDGCNYVCSFCIIPQARGRSRAISVERAREMAQGLVDVGYREIVLTGVNIGEYEATSGRRLEDLVVAILGVSGLERLRLSSVEPNTMSDSLLRALSGSPKFMGHFHLPLQSGDDDILRSMRRKYSVGDYQRVLERVKAFFPEAAIGADIIVGHPGETPEKFEKTRALLEASPVTHFHVFPYSRRRGTLSARMEGQVHEGEKRARVRELRALGQEKLVAFACGQVGQDRRVLFEKRVGPGEYEGHTEQFLRIRATSRQDLRGVIRPVRLTGPWRGELVGPPEGHGP